jgi:hypothetical protein
VTVALCWGSGLKTDGELTTVAFGTVDADAVPWPTTCKPTGTATAMVAAATAAAQRRGILLNASP